MAQAVQKSQKKRDPVLFRVKKHQPQLPSAREGRGSDGTRDEDAIVRKTEKPASNRSEAV